jgi:DNA-directed RNA polymerase subunit M/transcription elongation factor TFIIS
MTEKRTEQGNTNENNRKKEYTTQSKIRTSKLRKNDSPISPQDEQRYADEKGTRFATCKGCINLASTFWALARERKGNF